MYIFKVSIEKDDGEINSYQFSFLYYFISMFYVSTIKSGFDTVSKTRFVIYNFVSFELPLKSIFVFIHVLYILNPKSKHVVSNVSFGSLLF